jgi:hypothetical protein
MCNAKSSVANQPVAFAELHASGIDFPAAVGRKRVPAVEADELPIVQRARPAEGEVDRGDRRTGRG